MPIRYDAPTGPTSIEHRELDLAQALSSPIPTSEGDAAAQALADRLGCSRPEAYRRAVALVARLLEEVSP